MALNQIYGRFSKIFISTKNIFFLPIRSGGNYFFYFFLIILVFVVFIIISNLLGKKSKIEQQNLNSVIQSKEFSNLSDFFVSKLNSPYREIKYLIQNNDNIEKEELSEAISFRNFDH